MSTRSLRTAALLTILVTAASCAHVDTTPASRPPPPPPTAPIAVTVTGFHDALAPYGDWTYIPALGWVWRPHRHLVGVEFAPYESGGAWVYTSSGWIFETEWPWGEVVFHYGRWVWLEPDGWTWVPDTAWGPAWVEWRYGNGYVGWTPLPPPNVTVVVVTYRPRWCFVEYRDLPRGHYRESRLPEHNATAVYDRTQPVPPRGEPGGGARPVGPPIEAIARSANIDPSPRALQPPAPLPASVMHMPAAPAEAREETLPSTPKTPPVRPGTPMEPARREPDERRPPLTPPRNEPSRPTIPAPDPPRERRPEPARPTVTPPAAKPQDVTLEPQQQQQKKEKPQKKNQKPAPPVPGKPVTKGPVQRP